MLIGVARRAHVVLLTAALTAGCGATAAGGPPNSAAGPPGPPWPAEAALRSTPAPLSDGTSCEHPPQQRSAMSGDPGLMYRTPAAFAATAATILVAHAATQVAYWRQPPSPTRGVNLWPTTVTNYQVRQVIKGAAGAWVQAIETGADSHHIACPGLVAVFDELPTASVGADYVIAFNPPSDGSPPTITAWQRFEVRSGKVYADENGPLQVDGTELGAFVRQMAGDRARPWPD